ncbi:hypothetical protein [Flavobacterium sp. LC2016-12]|uniref:hypothetical protein n=1 Tax=Flavobacterium sp. LC2016-12 TaxID=2783794 RepID=UPI00188BB7C3|nr:hypothetical protein [Flavobacterium sp. LC2016-12]MBF4464124.1 hypothetical protein [Flavobacterium sp. LC2016-12]
MKILKIIAGYLLLFLAGFITLATINTFFTSLMSASVEFHKSKSSGVAHFLGGMIVIVLAVLLIRFLWRTGNKLIGKQKNVTLDSIDEIGKAES